MSLDTREHAELPALHAIPRRYVALGLIVVAIILLAALILIRNDTVTSTTSDKEVFNPAPTSVVAAVSQIPFTTVNTVGVTSVASRITAPSATGNTSLWQAARPGVAALPVIFFYGAEFAPYAAAERWPVIVALSRFGKFGPQELGLMQSSSTVVFPNIATFTFSRATYTSVWVDLQTVERYGSLNPTGKGYALLQTPTTREKASVTAYDSSATTFPLLDIANRYVLVGSSFTPSVLAGLSQVQIAADLAYPASPVTQAVVASANELTAAICTVTGQRPSAVCSARGVEAADSKMHIDPRG